MHPRYLLCFASPSVAKRDRVRGAMKWSREPPAPHMWTSPPDPLLPLPCSSPGPALCPLCPLCRSRGQAGSGDAGSSASSLPCRLAQSPEGPGALGQAVSAHLPPSARSVTCAQRVALPSDLTVGPPQKQADKQGSRAAVSVWFCSPSNSFWFHPSIFHDSQQEPEVRGQVRELFHLNLMKLCQPQALLQ